MKLLTDIMSIDLLCNVLLIDNTICHALRRIVNGCNLSACN